LPVRETKGHSDVAAPEPGRSAPSTPSSWIVLGFGVLLAALYAPVIWEGAHLWFSDENYAHGVFIIPVSLGLVWLQRDAIRRVALRPDLWGLAPLALGLIAECIGYLLGSKGLAMLSLVPTLAGVVLLLHGRELWKIVAFPVCFLVFTARLPGGLTDPISQWIQAVSTTGAVSLMNLLGYPLIQQGNLIELPGITLEVAAVCSGFKKLVALVAFSLLYGYLFRISRGKRLLLVAVAIPIAVLANIIRIGGLIAVTSAGGLTALHTAHDGAELVVLVVAYFLFVSFGKLIGCETSRFSR
jgi:exosortase